MVTYKGISLARIVKNNTVKFEFYRKNELWYSIVIDTGLDYENFQFPVPISDTGDGVFLASDKATMFMRYIQKHLKNIADEKEKQNETDKELPS